MEKQDDLPELEEIPRDSYTLIDLLDKLFPHRCILPGQTMESAHRYAGLRQLIDELVELKREELEAVAEESRQSPEDPLGYRVLSAGVKRDPRPH
jgi:hypothetical protein